MHLEHRLRLPLLGLDLHPLGDGHHLEGRPFQRHGQGPELLVFLDSDRYGDAGAGSGGSGWALAFLGIQSCRFAGPIDGN